MHVSWVGYVERNIWEVSARFSCCCRSVYAQLAFTNQLLNERPFPPSNEYSGAHSHTQNGVILKDHALKVENLRGIMELLYCKLTRRWIHGFVESSQSIGTY
ncbi:hypothetical protein X801_07622, partial [Opisthorchis viverrini]